ncbi:peptide ABC transporter substrate-binding protein, partial [Halobacteriales archaeon QH_10_67_13]
HQLLDEAFAGLGTPAYLYTPPAVFPGGANAYQQKAEQEYPYGFDERRPGEARELMEENGHSEDDPYQLLYTHHNDRQVDANRAQANLIRDQLQAVHIDVEIEQVPFSTVIDRAIEGSLETFTLGNGLDYPEAQDTLRFAWPSEGNFSNWEGTEATEAATQAWDQVINNPGPSEAETEARNEAYIQLEENSWEDIPDILLRHPIEIVFWRDGVDYRTPTSPFHRPQYNTVQLE